jgi:pyridoxine 4-dehydrogenase
MMPHTQGVMDMASTLGGRFTFPGTDLTVNRMGYGAMQLAGPGVFGPPRDRDEAIRVLRAAIEAGVDHIDTSDFYGPHVTNGIIREALHPYPDDLVIVTKIGARRGDDASWNPAFSAEALTAAVHANLRNLGVDALDVVNLRLMFGIHGPAEGSLEAPLTVLADLQRQGLVRHIGLSTVTETQIAEGRAIAEIVCVQNQYNIAHREDDAMIDALAADGIAYVPYFPLGGFSPLQSATLDDVAATLGRTAMQVALAWLLHRAPNIVGRASRRQSRGRDAGAPGRGARQAGWHRRRVAAAVSACFASPPRPPIWSG